MHQVYKTNLYTELGGFQPAGWTGPEVRLDSFSELFQVCATISEWYLSYGQAPMGAWIIW